MHMARCIDCSTRNAHVNTRHQNPYPRLHSHLSTRSDILTYTLRTQVESHHRPDCRRHRVGAGLDLQPQGREPDVRIPRPDSRADTPDLHRFVRMLINLPLQSFPEHVRPFLRGLLSDVGYVTLSHMYA